MKWLLESIIGVSSDEVLEQELGIGEVTGVVHPRLSVASDQSLLEIGGVPDPFFHLLSLAEVSSFGDKFVSSHLNVLIEEVARENLLSVLIVYHLRMEEGISKDCFIDKLHVSVVEHDVIVIKE